LDKIIGKKI